MGSSTTLSWFPEIDNDSNYQEQSETTNICQGKIVRPKLLLLINALLNIPCIAECGSAQQWSNVRYKLFDPYPDPIDIQNLLVISLSKNVSPVKYLRGSEQ